MDTEKPDSCFRMNNDKIQILYKNEIMNEYTIRMYEHLHGIKPIVHDKQLKIDDISKDLRLIRDEFSCKIDNDIYDILCNTNTMKISKWKHLKYKIGMIHDKIGMAFNYIFFHNLYKQLIYEYD